MAVEPSGGNAFITSPVNPSKASGIQVVDSRIYNSLNGKTCHQCRKKIRDFAAACKNQRNNKPCNIKICHKCLLNRYGEKAEEVAISGEWSCPKCRGICNCSVCMKRRGHQPTGMLIITAKASGFSSVSEMLLKKSERLNHEKVGAMLSSLKKEVGFSPRKKGKENSFERKVNATLPKSFDENPKRVKAVLNNNIDNVKSSMIINDESDKGKTDFNMIAGVLSNGNGSCGCQKKAKKMECDRAGEMGNTGNGNENQEGKLYSGGNLKENQNYMITPTKTDLVQTFDNDKRTEEEGSNKNFLKHHGADYHGDIPLPVGTELASIAEIDVHPEDIGNALQFLEFCSVFGKVLDLRKGQPENVLRDLLHGRSGRRVKSSLTVQFHIHLLSIIQTEQEKVSVTLSPSYGKNSWFNTLQKCLCETQSCLKAQGVDYLEKAADYETLKASEKLRVLNILCDEVLGTQKVRNWMNEQNTNLAQKVKEAKQKVLAAKDEEKILKQKMKDDITKAIVARNGALLSVSEQEAIVSHTKSEAAEAHTRLLESKDMLLNSKQTSDALRIEPIFMGHDGHAYWKLNCFGESDVLHQNVGKGDTLTLDEKWFALDAQGKEVIEKQITSFQGKLRAPRIPASFQPRKESGTN